MKVNLSYGLTLERYRTDIEPTLTRPLTNTLPVTKRDIIHDSKEGVGVLKRQAYQQTHHPCGF